MLHSEGTYDGAVVVIIQFHANLDDVLNVSNLIAVEVEQELHQDVHRKVEFGLGQGHEGQNQGMLLLDLVQNDISASCLSEFGVDDCSWDGLKEEHAEEDKNDEEDVVWFVVLDC